MKTAEFRTAEAKLVAKAKRLAQNFIDLDDDFAELEGSIDEKGLNPQLGVRPAGIVANARHYLAVFKQAEGNTMQRTGG